MTTRSGHIGSLVIAIIFALLMAAAWLPSRQDHPNDHKIVDVQGAHYLVANPISHKAQGSRMEAIGTAMPTGISESEPHIAAPEYKEQKTVEIKSREDRKAESKNMDFSWLVSFFVNLKVTDILIAVFVSLVWWNTRQIRKRIESASAAAAKQAAEFSKAAASMDKIVKAMNAMSALSAVNRAATAPVAKGKRGPKKKANKSNPTA